MTVEGQPRQKCKTLSENKPIGKKILKIKRTQGMAQVIEHLPNKCKALSFISHTRRKKKSTCVWDNVFGSWSCALTASSSVCLVASSRYQWSVQKAVCWQRAVG
jgi:hypothetical protein